MKKIILTIGLVAVLIGNTYALTKAQIRNQCRYLLNDIAATRWSDSVLDERIEIAHLDVVRKSRCLQGTTYYVTYTSTKEYTLPSDLLLIERTAFKITNSTPAAYKQITRYTLQGLDQDDSNWQNKGNGEPLKYYVWGNVLGLVPACSATYAGADRLRIDYIINPSSMSAETSTPFNDYDHLYPYHELLIWRVCMLCKLDERQYGEASMYENRYYKLLDLMIKELQMKPDYYPDFKM